MAMHDAPSPLRPPPPPVVVPALKVGALTGCTGLAAGGVIAVLRSSPTVGLFAAGTGLNCFALGSTYWAIRASMFRVLSDPATPPLRFTPAEKAYVSGAAGAMTGGGLGLVLRGPSNIIPGAIVWGLVGLAGQYVYDAADSRHTEELAQPQVKPEEKGPSLLDRAFRSEWSPVKKLTDDEYADMLGEKLLAVEAEIAVTDEEIQQLEERIRRSKN